MGLNQCYVTAEYHKVTTMDKKDKSSGNQTDYDNLMHWILRYWTEY